MTDVEVYDARRDARTFTGGMPVVTHAPCRAWSAHCSHQAKPEPGEKELANFCAEQLKKWGGVFEHPANSRAFAACGLPLPGAFPVRGKSGLWTIEVCQCWWGYPMLKKTWLCFSGVDPRNVHIPISLHPHGSDRRREQLMSHAERSKTTRSFGEWLVSIARNSSL